MAITWGKIMGRKYIDHTADILFEAEGKTIEELFEQCGLAVEESQIDLATVEAQEKKTFHIENKNVDGLLFDFLDDLLFYKDAEQLIFSKFEFKLQDPSNKEKFNYKLEVTGFGEKIDPGKHHQNVDVKAITMHMFEVKKTDDGWWAKVLIDI
jgi:SHS2 domain-containing protein